MGKVFRLTWELNLLLTFWARGIVLVHTILKQLTQPAGLAFFNCGIGTVLSSVQQLKVRFNLKEDALVPSLFPSSCIIYLWSTTFLKDWNFHVHPRLRFLVPSWRKIRQKIPINDTNTFFLFLNFHSNTKQNTKKFTKKRMNRCNKDNFRTIQ